MTAEERWIIDLAEILNLRLECSKCGTAVVIKPGEWKFAPGLCPGGCESFWEMPHVPDQRPSGLQRLAEGLRILLEEEATASRTGGDLPYRVKFEIRDPTLSKWG